MQNKNIYKVSNVDAIQAEVTSQLSTNCCVSLSKSIYFRGGMISSLSLLFRLGSDIFQPLFIANSIINLSFISVLEESDDFYEQFLSYEYILISILLIYFVILFFLHNEHYYYFYHFFSGFESGIFCYDWKYVYFVLFLY